jgi:RNA polymerase sigma-70 factor (ECF subfamily)
MGQQSPETTHGREDLALIRSALQGQGEAVRTLLQRLRCVPRMIVAQNRRIAQPLSQDALEDVIQEALIAVWTKLGDFAGRAAFETWVYPFCYFEFMRRARAEGARPSSLEGLPSPAELEDPTRAPLPAEFEPLLRELEALKPEESEVLRLKHFDGRTFELIAEQLGLSPNTVKTRYYRGLQRLRVRLAGRMRGHESRREMGRRVS